MAEFIIGLIDRGGYLGVFVVMLVETVFPPIPSELIMPFVGFAAAQERLNLHLAIAVGALGSLTGATILYLLARTISDEKINSFVERHGRWLTIERRELDRARDWFNRYSVTIVTLARLVPGVRSVISIPAGVAKMGMMKFVLYSSIGTTLWVSFLALAGYFLGSNYSSVEGPIATITNIIVVSALLIYFYRLVRYYYRRDKVSKSG